MLSHNPSSTRRRTAFLVVIVLLLAACGTQSSTSAVGETSGAANSTTTASADSVAPPTTGVASRSNAPRKIAYGPSAFQYGVLHLPDEPAVEPRPVAVLIHGGFWTNGYGLELMAFQAADLNDRGWAVWNIEYRRSGDPDGGGENTLADVAEALRTLDTVAKDEQLDLDNVVVIGHSSGGHLALWVNGVADVVQPALAIGQAAVVDLYSAAEDNLGGGATQAFLGGQPSEVPALYDAATPSIRGPVVLVHGVDDRIVPLDQVDTLRANSQVEIAEVAGGHFEHLDPSSQAWQRVLEALETYGLTP